MQKATMSLLGGILLSALHVSAADLHSQESARVRWAKQYGVSRGIYDPHIHTVIGDSGICYSLYYVAHYRRFTTMRDKIMTRVIDAVNETPGVEFAYPTERHIPTPPALPPVEPKHEDAQ